jgi:hypothetical protein
MFTWSHEDSIEVDLSIQKAWDFYTDPNNWLKWEDRFDAITLVGSLRAGSQIKAKIKNKPIHILMLVAEVSPYRECKWLVKSLFFTQESLCTFQEISPQKTRITFTIYVVSFLTPFIKKILVKNIEENRSKRLSAFAEVAGQI